MKYTILTQGTGNPEITTICLMTLQSYNGFVKSDLCLLLTLREPLHHPCGHEIAIQALKTGSR